MTTQTERLQYLLKHPLRFALQSLRAFRANQGFLLAAAVAYYSLLSIVPMLALMLVVLSHVMDQQQLLETTRAYLSLVAPGKAEALVLQAQVFLGHGQLVGAVGLVVLLFFSSLAFSALESAMRVIFFHRFELKRRHFLVSAFMPYAFIMALALGMVTVTAVSSGLHALAGRSVTLLGHSLSLDGTSAAAVYLLGIAGEVLLLSAVYLVMPLGRLRLRYALIGGVTATALWELTRHVLVWYLSTLSLVNVIYGSFATVIVILLSLDAAAVILLLGAQVIAEYERIGANDG